MELTPRTLGEEAPQPSRARRPWALAIVAAVVVALGVIAWQALNNASEYFYNADEAVAERADLEQKRFRLQGTVMEDSIERVEGGAAFTVAFNDVEVDVVHAGGTPELFQAGIPVVVSGRWDGEHFASDEILVRHDEEYEAENQDRIDDAEDGQSDGGSVGESGTGNSGVDDDS